MTAYAQVELVAVRPDGTRVSTMSEPGTLHRTGPFERRAIGMVRTGEFARVDVNAREPGKAWATVWSINDRGETWINPEA